MSQALDCVRDDYFATAEERALFETLADKGEVVASYASDSGWGHHSVTAVVSFEGAFYVVEGGGCSCDGSASVVGPFATREEAGHLDLAPGDNYSG